MRRVAGFGVLLFVAGFLLWSWAGDLEPPGPPGPTMVTLQDIFDKLDGLTAGGGGVPETGQTGCWDATGTSILCAGTGQDGEFRAGASVSPRFTDDGDGTVQDNLTGLIWLRLASCFGFTNWTTALSDANGLADGSCGLMDGSVAGDWRLPNVKELQSLVDFGQSNPALPTGHPFIGMTTFFSSTTVLNIEDRVWTVSFSSGNLGTDPKTFNFQHLAVRGGL